PICLALIAVPLAGCRSLRSSGHQVIRSSALFRDIAAAAGIRFRQGHGGRSPLNIRETIGTGCALLDADGDGWLDVFLVGESGCALYRNRGAGPSPAFEDVTAASGAAGSPPTEPGTRAAGGGRAWTGCAVGDIDGDGRPDLL